MHFKTHLVFLWKVPVWWKYISSPFLASGDEIHSIKISAFEVGGERRMQRSRLHVVTLGPHNARAAAANDHKLNSRHIITQQSASFVQEYAWEPAPAAAGTAGHLERKRSLLSARAKFNRL